MSLQTTTSNVAGLIQAVIFITNIVTILALTFVLGGFLRDRNSAATWTVAGQAFSRSHWPSLLRTDSVYSHGVHGPVLFLTIAITFMTYLISLARIITPLGLSQALVESSPTEASFQFAPDGSVFGKGTFSSRATEFSRICEIGVPPVLAKPLTCPYSDTVTTIEGFSDGSIDYEYPYGYNVSVPQRILDTYSSGTQNEATISNFFDIQYRQYQTIADTFYNNGSAFDVGILHMLQSLIDSADFLAVEGLVVDKVNGGVGFRNHTIPLGFPKGVSWVEDLLFLEPETVCVDTNLTLDFTIASTLSSGRYISIDSYVLTDRGGFSNLVQTYPEVNLTDAQTNPDLYGRAYKSAWLNNAYTAAYLNVTSINTNSSGVPTKAFSYLDSYVGKSFPMPLSTTLSFGQVPAPGTGMGYGAYLQLGDDGDGGVIANSSSPQDSRPYPNPFNINSTSFTDTSVACTYTGTIANISNVLIACNLMYGTPRHADGSPGVLFEANSSWTQPIYSCTSAVKAKVRTVSFTYSGETGTVQGLNVTNIQDKVYEEPDDMPLWGMEQAGDRYANWGISLVWGLVSASYQGDANVSTVRKSSLYLQGYTLPIPVFSSVSGDNMPGADAVLSCIGAAYSVGTSASLLSQPLDYTGQTNLALFYKWQNATQNASTAGIVQNLVFTDCMASLVVGTKSFSAVGSAAASEQGAPRARVTPTVQMVQYNYLFGIPAFLVALGLLLSLLAALATLIFQRHRPSRQRLLIQKTSAGRIYTALLDPQSSNFTDRAKSWGKAKGEEAIDPVEIWAERGGEQGMLPHEGKAVGGGDEPESPGDAAKDNMRTEATLFEARIVPESSSNNSQAAQT